MILAIIQARMRSTRLPNKTMLRVLGRPLIDYLLERLSKSRKIDQIIVATTKNREDDQIADFVKCRGYNIFRGSEMDVLARFYYAAKKYQPKHIVRITGDCPLIDPQICDLLIEQYLRQGVDYARLSPKFAEGLDCEVFSYNVLKYCFINAKFKSEREHVTLYVHDNINLFKKLILDNYIDDSKFRITVDEPEDFQVVKTIIESLTNQGSLPLKFTAIKQFLLKHPDILEINTHIIRNQGLLISLKKIPKTYNKSSKYDLCRVSSR